MGPLGAVAAVDDSSETVVTIARSWVGADPMVATGRGKQVNILLYNAVASNAVIDAGRSTTSRSLLRGVLSGSTVQRR